ncbi:hypothetical protein Focb16_v004842 [Fusarium oxysporum f. sp. cubense]|uniref:Uncharacterized protein n=1 Tax=Fusarium oxysporum f. sp. cubense TaxID=61366 RepID=A0A559LKD8_FUSOC|nr:hypothetical protein Focb16_v004842 [Fusarium oxysporum f. sp. cubense]
MGRYLDRWKNKTKELQIHILERLGPHGPKGWRKNKKAVWLTSLFSTEDILRNPEPQVKSEMVDENWFDQLPDATSEPKPQNPWQRSLEPQQPDLWYKSPEPPSNDQAPVEQDGENCPRESSPPAIPVQDAHLSQSPQLREPDPSNWENNVRDARSPVRQNLSPTTEDWRLAQHRDDHLEYGRWVNPVTPPPTPSTFRRTGQRPLSFSPTIRKHERQLVLCGGREFRCRYCRLVGHGFRS